jgi:hypothetical protein
MISTKTTRVHTDGIYHSEDYNELCIPYRAVADSNKSGRLLIKVEKGAVEALRNLMQAPTKYTVESISGEYRIHTRRAGGHHTSAEKSQIFTLALNIPLATVKDQVKEISEENEKTISYNINTRIEPSIYMGQTESFSYWSFNTNPKFSTEATEIKEALIDRNISAYIKGEQESPKITPFAWIDCDGRIIRTFKVTPESQHAAYDLLVAVEEVNKPVRHFQYTCGFYSELRNNGAFNYDHSIKIVNYDRDDNFAGIGLRVVRPLGSEDAIVLENTNDCRPDEGWKLLSADSRLPYSLSFVDTKDNHVYRYPAGVRVLLTPAAVVYDVVTLPFIFAALLIFGVG